MKWEAKDVLVRLLLGVHGLVYLADVTAVDGCVSESPRTVFTVYSFVKLCIVADVVQL